MSTLRLSEVEKRIVGGDEREGGLSRFASAAAAGNSSSNVAPPPPPPNVFVIRVNEGDEHSIMSQLHQRSSYMNLPGSSMFNFNNFLDSDYQQ